MRVLSQGDTWGGPEYLAPAAAEPLQSSASFDSISLTPLQERRIVGARQTQALRRGLVEPSGLVKRASGRWVARYSTVFVAVVLVLGAALSIALSAQQTPPVQGTIALEGTMKKFYRAANTIVVTTIDGVEHVYHFTKNLVVHGGKGAGVDALEGLQEGTTVVVHYSVAGVEQSAREIDWIGDEGLKITEGVVTRIDRGRKQITVGFDNKTSEIFQLTDRAAAEVAKDVDQAGLDATKIVIYYSDEAGHKTAHFFKRAPRP